MRGQIDVWHGGWPSSNFGWRLTIAVAASLVLWGMAACAVYAIGLI